LNTPIQLPAAVTDPEVRKLFCHGMNFTNLTMVMTAIIADRAVHRRPSQTVPHWQVFRAAARDKIAPITFLYFIRLSHWLNLSVFGLPRSAAPFVDEIARSPPHAAGAP
jgi:hypothetical protein